MPHLIFPSRDGRSGTFQIGNEKFSASLLDLPTVMESYKTYDDNALIKPADVGADNHGNGRRDPVPEGIECKHGLTPPMRDMLGSEGSTENLI
ncbi:putative TAFII55 protein region [Dioscorea sansibarensis]